MIEKPGPKHPHHRARFRDPLTGKLRKFTFDPTRYPDDASREAWCKRKSAELHLQRLDTREGVTSVALRDAMARYLAAGSGTLRERTLRDYTKHCGEFVEWAEAQDLKFARELTRAHLSAYRVELITRPSTKHARRRKPAAVNVGLRATATMLNAWRKLGWTDRREIDSDAISDSLQQLQVVTEDVAILDRDECRFLLGLWLAYDSELYALTRREKRKGLEPSTPRHVPMAAFVATVLCTGMRLSEALELQWGDVQIGHAIRLRAASVKTKRTRQFDLALAPGLNEILRALSLDYALDENAEPTARVFADLTLDVVESSRKRLAKQRERADETERAYWPERWSWQTLRQTAATVYANMTGVGPLRESQLLGHSWAVSERLYQGRMRVNPKATTIDQVLGISRELRRVAMSVNAR